MNSRPRCLITHTCEIRVKYGDYRWRSSVIAQDSSPRGRRVAVERCDHRTLFPQRNEQERTHREFLCRVGKTVAHVLYRSRNRSSSVSRKTQQNDCIRSSDHANSSHTGNRGWPFVWLSCDSSYRTRIITGVTYSSGDTHRH